MGYPLIAVLAASGLALGGGLASTGRSGDALPLTKAHLAPAAAREVGCFVPVAKGRMPKLAQIRAARASGSCAKPLSAAMLADPAAGGAGAGAGGAGGAGAGAGGAAGGAAAGGAGIGAGAIAGGVAAAGVAAGAAVAATSGGQTPQI
ncbi:MAG TPA: hypothetical protein VFF98_13380 [Novosphingobium sp.]|nr:hypothetical protein [Novosphingobium sp.]HZV08684.1 hypothetical protein [Novosphingobium sp.]